MRDLSPFIGGVSYTLLRRIRVGGGLPGFVTTSAPVMSRSGAIVNYTAGVYSPVPTGVLTTFYIDDVAQAPGSITFPYTLTAGSRMRSTELPSSVGYAGVPVPSNEVFYPLPNDIPDANWTYGEYDAANDAIAGADSRKTLITTTIAPQVGKEWRAYRGPTAGGNIAQLGTPLADVAGVYTWVSSGQNSLGGTVYCRIAETDTGGANPRWATASLVPYTASNTPAIPTGVTIASGTTAGAIDVLFSVAGDGRGRGILAPYATIDGGAPFALTPSGGGTGLRTFTALGTSPVNVTVFWRNANGDSTATTAVSVTPGVAATDIATVSRADVTYDGETFAWDVSAPVGAYHDGSPFVITNSALSVSAMGTPSATRDGGIADGAMSSKPDMESTNTQGFDGLIATYVQAQARTPYGSNIDPTAAGANYAIAANDEDTIIKSKRRSGVIAANSFWVVEKYLPVTFLPASKAPKVGDFRPGLCSLDKISRLNINELDLGCCRSLDLTGMGYPSVAVALARWAKAMPFFGLDGEQLRALQVTGPIAASNYMSDYAGPLIGDLLALLHSNITSAEKIQIAETIAPIACDIAAQLDRGYIGRAGAGQHEFYSNVLAAAAALFNSAYMLNALYSLRSNVDQVMWVDGAQDVGENTDWPAKNESSRFEYVVPIGSEDIGKAIWGVDGYYNIKMTQNGSQLNRTYGDDGGSGRARADTWAPILLFTANRAMPNGYDMICGGPGTPLNNTATAISHRSCIINRLDREIAVYPPTDTGISNRARALINATRSLWPQTKRLHVPDTIYYSNFVAGANSVTWDYSALVAGNCFSSSPITAQHLYLSQDNVQFVKIAGVAAIGSQAIPGGIAHWCSLALENAQGEGRRSYTFKHRTTEPANDRGYILPTGTPTGAVTCATLPALMQREFPDHDNVPWYVPITSTLPAGTPIFVGSGYWTGALSGAATTQLQIENTLGSNVWVDLGAPNVARYDPVISDANKGFRVAVTRNGVTAYSPRVTTASIPAIPAGAVIDTQFGKEFPLVYPAIWASILANSVSGTPTHRPHERWKGAGTTGPGGIVLIKSAGTPRIVGEVTGLTIGAQYRFQAEAVVEGYFKLAGDTAWSANGVFRLGSTASGTQYYTGPLTRDTTSGAPPMGSVKPLTIPIDITFTATTTSVWFYSSVATGTGGAVGGYPALASLKVAPA